MCSEAGRLQEEKELLVEVIQEPGCSPYPRGWRYPHLGDGQLLEVPERALPPLVCPVQALCLYFHAPQEQPLSRAHTASPIGKETCKSWEKHGETTVKQQAEPVRDVAGQKGKRTGFFSPVLLHFHTFPRSPSNPSRSMTLFHVIHPTWSGSTARLGGARLRAFLPPGLFFLSLGVPGDGKHEVSPDWATLGASGPIWLSKWKVLSFTALH